MGTDTKKCNILLWKYTIIVTHHEHTPRGRGLARVAGQSCLAGPAVSPAAPGFGHRLGWEYGREPRPESQVFLCIAMHFLAHHGSCASCNPSSTCIVPRALASQTPAHCPGRLCICFASAGHRLNTLVGAELKPTQSVAREFAQSGVDCW